MRNDILRKITIVMAVALLLLTILTVVAFIIVSIDDSITQITAFSEASVSQIEEFSSLNDLDKFIYYKEESNIRITIISSDGDVLKDTDGTSSLINKNLLNDKTVKDLINSDFGASKPKIESPYQNSHNMLTYYVKVATAEQVDPNEFLIVRFSMQIVLGSKPFAILVTAMVAFWIIMVGSIAVIFNFNIKATMAPLEKVQGIMESIQSGTYKPVDKDPRPLDSEADKLVNQIDSIGGMIDASMTELKDEKNKSNALLKSVQQGIIAIDIQSQVVMSNEQANTLLGFTPKEKNDFYNNMSEEQLLEIKKSFKTKSPCSFEIGINNKCLRIDTIFNDEELFKSQEFYMMIILTDITEERNAAKAKNEFFANASHELKTPLTAIGGYSELLLMGNNSEKNITKCAKEINDNTIRMKELINKMLELSKMDSNTNELAKEDFSLNSLCKEISSELSIISKNKNVEISIEGDSIINAHYKLMMMLVKNLLNNAIKYNKQNGYVKINIQDLEEKTVLSVSDNGIGIAKENQEKIFDRFYRVDESRTIKEGEESSTGLGLAIVKQVAKQENGEIKVESELGKGSIFTITFKK